MAFYNESVNVRIFTMDDSLCEFDRGNLLIHFGHSSEIPFDTVSTPIEILDTREQTRVYIQYNGLKNDSKLRKVLRNPATMYATRQGKKVFIELSEPVESGHKPFLLSTFYLSGADPIERVIDNPLKCWWTDVFNSQEYVRTYFMTITSENRAIEFVQRNQIISAGYRCSVSYK